MHKLYIVLLAAFFLNISLSHASNTVDSIGVENNKGKKLIIHKIEAKETYYSIAKRYNVNYKDVMSFNDNKLLQIGTIIKVPTEIPFVTPAPIAQPSTDFIEYTIKAKDNLNLLANKYGTTVDDIKKLNNLNSINLQIGQVLKIPKGSVAVTEEVKHVSVTPQKPEEKKPEETKVPENANTSIIEHSIKAKENLNILAQKYGTTVEEIKKLNGLTSNNLRIGQILRIPTTAEGFEEQAPEKVVTPSKTSTKLEPQPTENTFEHLVVAGETIYSIAKKYNLTTFQLKTANNLTSNEVTVGQKLTIKSTKPVVATEDDDENTGTNPNTIKDPTLRLPASRYGLTQFEEKGTAVWISDADLDPTKMLILHRTAPVGTIIKITNPMSNRSTYAKVVGKFTENESTKDVIIVMTKAVADAVGALDKRFFCNITYGAQENDQ